MSKAGSETKIATAKCVNIIAQRIAAPSRSTKR